MLRTQNNANNSYYFATAVSNYSKYTSCLAVPFYDYHLMTIILRVCRLVCKNDERIYTY